MTQILDILSATVVGGLIFLMIANSNVRILDFSEEILISTITEFDAVESVEILEFDFYKIGYGITKTNKILVADSNQIKYYTDITSLSIPEGNGVLDSIEYKFDNTSPISSTDNPHDFPLYRTENNISKIQIGRVTSFTLSYYDSLFNEISYSLLQLQSNRNKIRSINMVIEYQAAFTVDTNYKSVVWEKTIRPKNL